MATQVQWRRGTAAQVAAFTGAAGEVVVNTTANRLVVQDGVTAGGWPAASSTDVTQLQKGIQQNSYVGSAGTLTAGTSSGANASTTLNDTAQAWTVNAYVGATVNITGGTGVGQSRTISSNTATTLTLSSAWGVVPDSTSTYSIPAISGTADAITATISPAPTSLAAFQSVIFTATATNLTATPTLNLNGLGAKTIKKGNGALSASDIQAGATYLVIYDGSAWQLFGEVVTSSVAYGGATVTNPMTSNITLTFTSARVQVVKPNALGLAITVPDATTMPALGGPAFIVDNIGLYPVQVRNAAGSVIGWAIPGQKTPFLLEGNTGPVASSGTSTGANTATTFNDTGQAWTVNAFAGGTLRITSGGASGETATIVANTATQLTLGGTGLTPTTPGSGAGYTITPLANSAAAGSWAVATGDVSKDNGVYWYGGFGVAGATATVPNVAICQLDAQYGILLVFNGTSVLSYGYQEVDGFIQFGSSSTFCSTNFVSGLGSNVDICRNTATQAFVIYSTTSTSTTNAVTIDLNTTTLATTVNTPFFLANSGSSAYGGLSCAQVATNLMFVTWNAAGSGLCAMVTISSGVCSKASQASLPSIHPYVRSCVLSATLAHVLYGSGGNTTDATICRVVLSGTSTPVPGTPVSLGGARSVIGAGFTLIPLTSIASATVTSGQFLAPLYAQVFTDTGSTVAISETQLTPTSAASASNILIQNATFIGVPGGPIALIAQSNSASGYTAYCQNVHFNGNLASISGALPVPSWLNQSSSGVTNPQEVIRPFNGGCLFYNIISNSAGAAVAVPLVLA